MSLYDALRRLLASPQGITGEKGRPARSKLESDLRGDAERILRAAIAAVDPKNRVIEALRGSLVEIPGASRIRVAGFGCFAAAMSRGAVHVLGNRIDEGVVIVPAGAEPSAPARLDAFGGGHPLPDPGGEAGSRAIRQMARELGPEDLLLCLVSPGGSSLLTLPPDGLPLEDVRTVARLLSRNGASRAELNCVLKHLDLLKGGRLAQEAAPARVIALVLSDAPGDPLDVIASGPVSPDPTRFSDAKTTLKKYGVWEQVPLAVRGWRDRGLAGEISDSPDRGDPCFERVVATVIGSGHDAARAACEQAGRLGYEAQLLTPTLSGAADETGRFLAATATSLAAARAPDQPPLCLISAGELIRGAADGTARGANSELVFAAAPDLAPLNPVLIASMASAGQDGSRVEAGAIATGRTLQRATEAGIDFEQARARGEVCAVFETLEDLIVSGPTGTDVGDLQILLLG